MLTEFKPIQALCVSLLPVRMMKIKSIMTALERSQHFSQYKSMGICTDAKGQLNPKSMVGSCRISNSSEFL